jgi:glycosyltransferase involved in cell wall biosynthesis
VRVLQINSIANSGSTGRITEEIGNVVLAHGHESYIAYGRGKAKSTSKLYKIGSDFDVYLHGAYTMLTDKHGLGAASIHATKKLIQWVNKISPDLIALHNLHGYYLNLPILFNYFCDSKIPIVWTLFDCWAFTGHCSYFDDISCKKWESHCDKCPKHRNYPASWVDNSFQNFEDKRYLFTLPQRMELITHSQWLADLVKKSFLAKYNVNITPSAINLELFKPKSSYLNKKYSLEGKKVLLGCANTWTNRKGYDDFIELSSLISSDYQIVMIGLNERELKGLPKNILGLKRTESIKELAEWYSIAHIFLNLTLQDNFPTTNLESLACGTPVITYSTGGSSEAIDPNTGFVVNKGDLKGVLEEIVKVGSLDYEKISKACRARAERLYDRRIRYLDYLNIFERMLQG